MVKAKIVFFCILILSIFQNGFTEDNIKLPSGRNIVLDSYAKSRFVYIKNDFKLYKAPDVKSSFGVKGKIKVLFLEDVNNWSYVITEDNVRGWIDTYVIKNSFDIDYYKNVKDYKADTEIKDSLLKKKYWEYKVIQKKKNFERFGPLLFVNSGDRRKVFIDNYEHSYNLIYVINEKNFIVAISGFEDNRYYLYNIDKSDFESIYSLPLYSSKMDKFITCGSVGYEDIYYLNIFSVKNNGLIKKEAELEFNNIMPSEYEITNIKWIDSSLITFSFSGIDNNRNSKVYLDKNGEWKIE